MSMKYYATNDYGLMLDKKAMKLIASKVFDDFIDDEEEYGDWVYELYDKGICSYISEFTGETYSLTNDGVPIWSDSEDYNCDKIYYIPTSKYPTLFKRAYNNMEEIVDEFKTKLSAYLSEDFDYRSRIRLIIGTYYG